MDTHEIWAAAQLTPGEGIEDGVDRIEALIEADRKDAERFRKLCALLQRGYDGETIETPRLSAYCSMLSGWKDMRQVKAELIWQDTRDEPLDLRGALDAVELGQAD